MFKSKLQVVSLFALGLVLSVVSVGEWTRLLPSSTAAAGKFFVDDFSDGAIDDGVPVTWLPGGSPAGQRDASSGDLVHTPVPNTGMSTYVVTEFYDDVSLRTQFQVNAPDAGYVALFARSRRVSTTTGVPTLYGAVRPSGSQAAIAAFYDGGVEFLKTQSLPFETIGQNVNLRFDLQGDSLRLWAWRDDMAFPLQPTLTALVPADFPNEVGTIGVDTINGFGGVARPTVFRFFEAAPIPEPSAAVIGMLLLGPLFVWQRRRSR